MHSVNEIVGSVFRPGTDGTAPRFSQPRGFERQRLKSRLLVVDDEKAIRELVTIYFEAKGLEVTTTGTVEAARPLIERGEFDLMILDWKLRDADGLDLLNLSKATHPELPVLIFTGAEDQVDLLKKAFAGRADAVVRKMGSFGALAAEVAARLGSLDRG
jgi:DNA-binding response OmpR family regulator